MAKLFFTLYLMVVASFGVFALYTSSIFYLGENFGSGSTIDEEVSKGTVMLLNKSFDGLNKLETEKLFKQYKNLFGDEFKLLDKSELHLDDEDLKELEKNKKVQVEEKNSHYLNGTMTHDEEEDLLILYAARTNSNQIWRLDLDFGLDISLNENGFAVTVSGGSFAKGMMRLLQQELNSQPENKWTDIINQLQPRFGLPLKIINTSDILEKLVNKQKLLSSEKEIIINITQSTKFATLVQAIPNSNRLLQVGPVEIPWYMRNMPYLFILAFVLAFATTLLIWLWPLWSNLIKIRNAAESFGSGNYDTRIPHKKWSPIAKVSDSFNAMAERTQNSIRAQKELTSAVSHELRTPVARMRFALEMLANGDDPKDKKRFVNDLNTDINELDLLLEELLSFARLDQADLQLNFTNNKLFTWIKGSMKKLEPLAKDKSLSFVIQNIKANETALFESRMMARVLDNLVQNGLRYAVERVEVRFSKDQENYRIIVDDDGKGIAKNKREKVFEAFSRIDASRDRASGGFGLGLAIANRIIKAHHGQIKISDSNLGGACFEVSWPINKV